MSAATPGEARKAILRRYLDEVWNRGNLAIIDELIAPDCEFDGPDITGGRGPEAARRFAVLYRTAFPDTKLVCEELLADGDKVVCRWTVTGSQTGDLPGLPATGKAVRVTGIDIVKMEGGTLTHVWSEWDGLSLRRQLGVISE
jgi:steroid delta-isomerase-like uncharacterized protein